MLGAVTSSPYTIAWNATASGSYDLTAMATDSNGASAVSSSVTLTVAPPLSFLAGFEVAEGYALGSLDGQVGWTSSTPGATVTTTAAQGAQALQLTAGASAFASRTIAPPPNRGVVFFDFLAQPSAAALPGESSLISAGGGVLGFLLGSGTASVRALDGNGSGGGAWTAPVPQVDWPLGSGSSQSADWHRFTLREDFASNTWDLSVDGQLVAVDLGFRDVPPATIEFSILGQADASTRLDALYVGEANPVFQDTASDGIPDSWKTLYGLDPASNLRQVSPNDSGMPMIEYYRLGLNPADPLAGRAVACESPSDILQISYAYDASGRLASVSYGAQATQTLVCDGAANLTSASAAVQPIVAWRQAQGIPADGTGLGADSVFPSGDNLPNLAKYAFGLPPLSPANGSYPSVLVVQEDGVSCVALAYDRPEPAPADLTYLVEVSSDGSVWASASDDTVPVSSVVTGGMAHVVVRDATPATPPHYGRAIRLRLIRSNLSL